jgi:general secretion pathway protein K
MTVEKAMERLAASASSKMGVSVYGSRQSGVALLQVLLIATIISVLAIRFTETARNQLDIASKFEDRIRAQLLTKSVINEVVFTELSDTVETLITTEKQSADFQYYSEKINYWGEPFSWGENITISMQDLNGLAPQRYSGHPVWRRLLVFQGLPSADVNRYLGELGDIQDPDRRSWMFGDIEPDKTRSGHAYLNGYAQSDMVLRWVFSDSPQLLQKLLDVSHVRAPFRMNILHSPAYLIRALFDPEIANTLIRARSENTQHRLQLSQLIPSDFTPESISRYTSGDQKITVVAKVGNTLWQDSNILKLSPRAAIPYSILSGGG